MLAQLVEKHNAEIAYSMDTFPGLKRNQLIFPLPGFHSSPRILASSFSVIPGGSLRRTALVLSTGGLKRLCCDAFESTAGIGNTPAWDFVICTVDVDILKQGLFIPISPTTTEIVELVASEYNISSGSTS